jgi:hypothetical protein
MSDKDMALIMYTSWAFMSCAYSPFGCFKGYMLRGAACNTAKDSKCWPAEVLQGFLKY